jgi:hypothetical protein
VNLASPKLRQATTTGSKPSWVEFSTGDGSWVTTMLDFWLEVTVNSDISVYFAAYLTENLESVAESASLSRLKLVQLTEPVSIQ